MHNSNSNYAMCMINNCSCLILQSDVYFTSSSNMVHTTLSNKTPTTGRSFANIPTKLPKNFDRRDLKHTSSANENLTYVYKISKENMTGRRDLDVGLGGRLGSSVSLRNSSGSEESISKAEVASDDCNSDGSVHSSRMDYIHPAFRDEEVPMIRRSFQEEEEEEDGERGSLRNALLKKGHSNSMRLNSCSDSVSHDASHASVNRSEICVKHKPLQGRSSLPLTQSAVQVKVTLPHDSKQTHHKLRRARKVLTSRKSLDSGSRWLYPYFPSHDDGDTSSGSCDHVTSYVAPDKDDLPEILGLLENVVYSSPDSGVHGDFSLSSNYSDSATTRGEFEHH